MQPESTLHRIYGSMNQISIFYLESHLHLELRANVLENDYCSCWKTVHIYIMTQSYVEICFCITQSKAILPGTIILTYKTLTGITILACITNLSFPEGQQAICLFSFLLVELCVNQQMLENISSLKTMSEIGLNFYDGKLQTTKINWLYDSVSVHTQYRRRQDSCCFCNTVESQSGPGSKFGCGPLRPSNIFSSNGIIVK